MKERKVEKIREQMKPQVTLTYACSLLQFSLNNIKEAFFFAVGGTPYVISIT